MDGTKVEKFAQVKNVLNMFLSCGINDTREVFDIFSSISGAVRHTENSKQGFLYVAGARKDRILLVAHADTVWDREYVLRDVKQTIKWTNGICHGEDNSCGIGADDRAGCALVYALKDSGHSLLILDGEECGSIGAQYLRDNYPLLFDELNGHNYAIQFDRRNSIDYKCYNIPVSKEFTDYIEANTGYVNAGRGSSTDIITLCRDICGVNLSVGYYDEHTPRESLRYNDWLNTYIKVSEMLSKPQRKFCLDDRSF